MDYVVLLYNKGGDRMKGFKKARKSSIKTYKHTYKRLYNEVKREIELLQKNGEEVPNGYYDLLSHYKSRSECLLVYDLIHIAIIVSIVVSIFITIAFFLKQFLY